MSSQVELRDRYPGTEMSSQEEQRETDARRKDEQSDGAGRQVAAQVHRARMQTDNYMV